MAEKVVAYVTWGGRVLVFRHVDVPQAKVQVPAGTVEAGEDLWEAVVREAEEETGLAGLEVVSYLGRRDYTFRNEEGAQPTRRRHFFHLRFEGEAPERWRHMERYPSEGPEEEILFELWWVRPEEAKLDWGFGEMLGEIGFSH